jgi:type II secretory pathway pseudopilin PulG
MTIPRIKKSFPELLLESAMIVLSVLLALAANNWAEERKLQHLANQARSSFVQELRANKERVTALYPYHQALTQAVLHVDSAGGVKTYEEWKRRVPIWSGFQPPDVTTTAWQTALSTGALGNMPYAQVGILSDVYTLQLKLDAFNGSYITLFDFSDAAMPATVRRMHAYMQTVLNFETALLKDYDAALAALGTVAPRE